MKKVPNAARVRKCTAVPTVDAALATLRRIEPRHLTDYAANFEAQAKGHPERKTRLALALAALLRALAALPAPVAQEAGSAPGRP